MLADAERGADAAVNEEFGEFVTYKDFDVEIAKAVLAQEPLWVKVRPPVFVPQPLTEHSTGLHAMYETTYLRRLHG